MKLNNLSLILLFCVLVLSCKPKYDEIAPKIAPVTEAVFASGSIDPKDAYILTSLSDGFIIKSLVTENDLVHDHQLLFQLDNRQQHTQVNIARTNVEYSQINASASSPTLLQIKAQIDAALVKLQTDSITLNRYEHLYLTNSVSKQDLDNMRMNFTSSLSAYKVALANYNSANDKAKQDLANSISQLQNAQEGNEYFNLYAIGMSKVYQIFKKQGDLVRRGEQVAQLGNPDSIVINLDVDEGSISKIALGQKVLIELNTEKNKPYNAVISKIYPHFNETSQSYKVEAKFTGDNKNFIAGTQLQANIITAKKESAMLIPHVYISTGNKVVLKHETKMDTVSIITGIISDDWVEVTSGLKTSDILVKLK